MALLRIRPHLRVFRCQALFIDLRHAALGADNLYLRRDSMQDLDEHEVQTYLISAESWHRESPEHSDWFLSEQPVIKRWRKFCGTGSHLPSIDRTRAAGR